MTLTELALKLRPLIVKAAQGLSDADASEVPQLFDAWKSGVEYTPGYKIRYQGITYRCLIGHISQENWSPDAAPSLWCKVLVSDHGQILQWEQPDSTNPYAKGDKVLHKGKTWVSNIDINVWEPGVYGWIEVV